MAQRGVSNSVQFWGAKSVLKAYEYKGVPSWALWQGNALIHSCECDDLATGQAELEAFLMMLGESTNAIYCLKVYSDIDSKGDIKENTVAKSSFNFRLNAETQALTVGAVSRLNNQELLLQELAELKQEVKELREGKDEEEEPSTLENRTMGVIDRITQNPVLVGVLNKVFNTDFKPTAKATIGAVHNEQEYETALRVLKEKDPAISSHLYKLAQLATHKPEQFNSLAAMLDQIK